MNINKKPSGVMKGSGTMAAKGDLKGRAHVANNVGIKKSSSYYGSSTSSNPKELTAKKLIMAKVMKANPKGPSNSVSKVVSNNRASRDMGTALSAGSKRVSRFIGK